MPNSDKQQVFLNKAAFSREMMRFHANLGFHLNEIFLYNSLTSRVEPHVDGILINVSNLKTQNTLS